MSAPRLAPLTKELNVAPPSALETLGDERIADLAAAVRAARHAQAQELAAAGERALSHIPRLLRGPIRKVVGAP